MTMMESSSLGLLAIDLGKHKIGYCRIGGDGNVIAAGTLNHTGGESIVDFFGDVSMLTRVVEWPRKYSHRRKPHPNIDELLDVGVHLARAWGPWAEKYAPSDWKGNVPKAAHRARIARALSREEFEAISNHLSEHGYGAYAEDWMASAASHDMWDAIGIALFAIGRTGRGGTHKQRR